MVVASRRRSDVDRLLAGIPSPQKEVAKALREFILATGPQLDETVKWGAPCYRGKKLVCSIAAHSDRTNLEFYRGTSLPDPGGLLEGTGKSLRHVKFHASADLKRGGLRPLLLAAIALDPL